jgi:hypothetical protein
MDRDYGEEGFQLSKDQMSCCSAEHTLHELEYQWPQGFARCELSLTNPNIGKLSDAQRVQLESLLGCRVRIIYQHL